MDKVGITVKDIVRFAYFLIAMIIATSIAVYAKSEAVSDNTRDIKEIKLVVNDNTETIKEMRSSDESRNNEVDNKIAGIKGDQDYMLLILKSVATKVDAPIPIRDNTP
jgi:hypothetical protein